MGKATAPQGRLTTVARGRVVALGLAALMVAPLLTATLPPVAAEAGPGVHAWFDDGWSMDADGNRLDDTLDRELAEGRQGTVWAFALYDRRPTAADAALLEREHGVARSYVFRNIDAIQVETTYARIAALASAPGVVGVEKFEPPTLEMDNSGKAIRAARAEGVPVIDGIDHLLSVHETLGYRGEGMVIAVLDTGADNHHESLDDLDDDPLTDDPKQVTRTDPATGVRLFGAADTADGFVVKDCIDPNDDGGHGSHTSGTAVGTGGPGKRFPGIAPQAKLVEVDIAPVAVGQGMALGFDWIISFNKGMTCFGDPGEDRIDVASISFGMGGDNPGSTLNRLFTEVVRAGITFVVSAGNSGDGARTNTKGPEGSIMVGNVQDFNTVQRSDDGMAPSSSRGPRSVGDGDADPLDDLQPHVGAPGTRITSAAVGTVNGYIGFSGTSMAAPHVAGVAALMLQANPGLRPVDQPTWQAMGNPGAVPIRDLLIQSAQQRTFTLGAPPQFAQNGMFGLPWNNAAGYGMVDAFVAVSNAKRLADGGVVAVARGPYTAAGMGATVTLTAFAVGGTPPYSFAWDLGNGLAGSGPAVSTSYAVQGTYRPRVTVTDAAGSAHSDATVVTVPGPPKGTAVRSHAFDGAADCSAAEGWFGAQGAEANTQDALNPSAGALGSPWHLTATKPASGTCAWYHGLDQTRQYTPLARADLYSPGGDGCFHLPPGSKGASLVFDLAGDSERRFDFLYVQARRGPCLDAPPAPGMDPQFLVLTAYTNPVGSLVPAIPTYVTQQVSLAPLLAAGGGPFQVRFHFTSDEQIERVGWQVDNVRLFVENGPPVLGPMPDITMFDTETLAYQVPASDPDGDPLTYTAEGLPPGATLDASTGLLAWSPTGADGPGTYPIGITVGDGLFSASGTLTIHVLNVPPVAAGTASETVVDRIHPVKFRDASTDADGDVVRWRWDFGDGVSKEERNPAHLYRQLGTFDVHLTVWDDDGDSDATKVATITVLNVPPKGNMKGNGPSAGERDWEANRVDPVQFHDDSHDPDGEVVAWDWRFGDGGTSAARDPSRQYSALGVYTVRLAVTDNDGDSDDAPTGTVRVVNLLPAPAFDHDPHHVIAFTPVKFQDLSTDRDGSVASWAWDFGDGAGSREREPTHVFLEGGWHRVALTVTDNDGGAATLVRDVHVCMPGASTDALVEERRLRLEFEGCVRLNGGDLPV